MAVLFGQISPKRPAVGGSPCEAALAPGRRGRPQRQARPPQPATMAASGAAAGWAVATSGHVLDEAHLSNEDQRNAANGVR